MKTIGWVLLYKALIVPTRLDGFGKKGTSLLYNNTPVVGSYVRIGFNEKGNWMLNKLRSDFSPSEKVQTEDDITASITIPRNQLNNLNPEFTNKSLKLLVNCEAHLFQRPDEAVVRGYDKGAELDIVTNGRFLTNYELLKKEDAIALYEAQKPFHFDFGYDGQIKVIENTFLSVSGILNPSNKADEILQARLNLFA